MALSEKDRRRRVIILCASFTRNVAYFRAGWEEDAVHLLNRNALGVGFWRQANGNCLDLCVLEWCKLFADKKGRHHWSKVVLGASFEADLLNHLNMNAAEFEAYMAAMRHYRDKFVAHLDEEGVMNIPRLDAAQAAVSFLYNHIVANSAPGDLRGLPSGDIQRGYEECLAEARSIFQGVEGQ